MSNRKQRVVLNGSPSVYSCVKSGVPQGSVLGPLLFLVYINDLEWNITSNIKFFVDDTMLFSIVKDPGISASDLNHDLEIIRQWVHQWKLEFNPTKQAMEVLFSCKKFRPIHPQLIFNGSIVKKVHEHKHLDLILDSALSFERHLNEKMIKTKKIIGIIKHLSRFFPLKTLDQMYKTLVRSHLDYCDIIYHIPPKQGQLGLILNSLMAKVEKIQYQAALAVTGSWQGSSHSKLYEELGWESLSDRRWCRRIIQIQKIACSMSPSYLQIKLPPHRRTLFDHNPRNTFHEIKCKSFRYMNSFFPDAIRSWNNVITHFPNVPSIYSLKGHIKSLICPKAKSTFGVHDPLGIRYLFQLRVDLSPLRSHQKNHNFIDTPSGLCHCRLDIEDTKHFLFSCPSYTFPRTTLMINVMTILRRYNLNDFGNQTQLYLYGHNDISDVDNRNIILATLKFIKETHRFSD